jgi:hypothetical protein
MSDSIQKQISDAEYFADHDFVNASKLKILLDKPSIYLDVEQGDSEAKRFGRAFHYFLLEPTAFFERYWVMPEQYEGPTYKAGKKVLDWAVEKWDFRKTHHKEVKDELEAKNAKLSMLMPEEYTAIQRMMDSVFQYGMQERFLDGGEAEISTFHEKFKWKYEVDNPEQGNATWPLKIQFERYSKVKVKTDYKISKEDKVIVTDVKSTRDASAFEFAKEVYNMHYDLQMALQIDMISQHEGKPVDYYWLACEKTFPFCCAWYKPDTAMIASGRKKIAIALDRWEQYLLDGFTTTYSAAKYPETLVSPAWKVDKE